MYSSAPEKFQYPGEPTRHCLAPLFANYLSVSPWNPYTHWDFYYLIKNSHSFLECRTVLWFCSDYSFENKWAYKNKKTYYEDRQWTPEHFQPTAGPRVHRFSISVRTCVFCWVGKIYTIKLSLVWASKPSYSSSRTFLLFLVRPPYCIKTNGKKMKKLETMEAFVLYISFELWE